MSNYITNANQMKKICYGDVCSLYPYFNKYSKYPLRHQKLITEGFETVDQHNHPYEDSIKSNILAPNALYHLVLPYHHSGKLWFASCKTCVPNQQQTPCQHEEKERALSGTWATLELYKALEKGYKILEIYEVRHYFEIEQYDSVNNPDGGLFSQYINTFMKMKSENEGYPTQAQIQQQKQEYIDKVYE